ncbi:MAG: hypothetical protein A2297_01705 [Elusimicrobia bacterium RIFOXYB2_FULL_48_7]|nr:MAG: hypothetical protein A2297_01705 [Elusimicrobia bacterium RIFOXYB2_FULL_48_7]
MQGNFRQIFAVILFSFMLAGCKVSQECTRQTHEYLGEYLGAAQSGEWDKARASVNKLLAMKEIDSEAVQSFIKANGSDEAACCIFIEIVGDSGSKKTVKPLIAMLEQEKNVNIKTSIIYALGKLKDKRASGSLEKILNDESWSIRMMAREALKEIENGAK